MGRVRGVVVIGNLLWELLCNMYMEIEKIGLIISDYE